jgi:hypothetical protein
MSLRLGYCVEIRHPIPAYHLVDAWHSHELSMVVTSRGFEMAEEYY